MSYVEKHLIEERRSFTKPVHWIVLVMPVLLGLLIGLPGWHCLCASRRAPVTQRDVRIHDGRGSDLLVFALVCIALRHLEQKRQRK